VFWSDNGNAFNFVLKHKEISVVVKKKKRNKRNETECHSNVLQITVNKIKSNWIKSLSSFYISVAFCLKEKDFCFACWWWKRPSKRLKTDRVENMVTTSKYVWIKNAQWRILFCIQETPQARARMHTQAENYQQPGRPILLKRKLLRLSTTAYPVHIPERKFVVILATESCSYTLPLFFLLIWWVNCHVHDPHDAAMQCGTLPLCLRLPRVVATETQSIA
jgi:hypothetical protein